MKPIIKWQTHTTEATAKVLGVELSVKSNGKGKFESTVYCSGMRPEKDHTFDTLDDGKAWCEQTLQRCINASFEPVSEPLSDTQPTEATERLTLIEKLEQEVNRIIELKAKEKPHSLGYVFLGHHIVATVNAINIVKRHSDWVSVDERLPDKDGKYLVFCVGNRELTKDRKELSIMRFNQKTKGGWFALSPLFKVIYWQPIQPPSEVQECF